MALDMNGFVLLHKAAGKTSFASLNPFKKMLPKGYKVGHCGTLDRFAEGLLIAMVGKATKLNVEFSNFDKKYRFTMKLGQQTDSLDPEGSVIETKELPVYSDNKLSTVLHSFVGRQEQVPPLYSAIHVDGKRASDRARDGQDFQIKARSINIYSLDLINIELQGDSIAHLELEVCCSKGTYVRSLARDIAYSLGSVAYVVKLTRLAIGTYSNDKDWQFDLSNAKIIDNIDLDKDLISLSKLPDFLNNWQTMTVKDTFVPRVKLGNLLRDDFLDEEVKENKLVLVDSNGVFLACVEKIDDNFRYIMVGS